MTTTQKIKSNDTLVYIGGNNLYQNINTKAVLITADGDFASTVKFLRDNTALEIVLAPCPPVAYFPSGKKYNPMSYLIRKLRVSIEYVDIYTDSIKRFKPKKPPMGDF